MPAWLNGGSRNPYHRFSDVIFVSYSDMLRVPGSQSDLFQAKANGAGRSDRLFPAGRSADRPRAVPDAQVVFFGVGFETTAPANAMAVWQARHQGLKNFSMIVPPAMRLILGSPANRVQGFIAPGHVCAVMRGFVQRVSAFPSSSVALSRWTCSKAIAMLVGANLKKDARNWKNEYVRSVNCRQSSRRLSGGVRGFRPQMARNRLQLHERLSLARSVCRLRRRTHLRRRDGAEEPAECISALGVLQGLKSRQLRRFWQAMHTAYASGLHLSFSSEGVPPIQYRRYAANNSL